ncbi:DEAD/DEAH box helicase family protein [Pseudophaeobacter sp.]|uniref:DEAD/DEAH box helicase n=1 Tax=Pseudophaeobacter sp. TaxID=1971739 RepID=UPI00329945B5
MSDLFEDVREVDIKFEESQRVFGSIHGASMVAHGTGSEVQRLKIRAFKQRMLLGVVGTNKDGVDFLFLPRKTTAKVPFDNVFLCPTATDVESFSKRDICSEPKKLSPKPLDPKTDQNAIAELKTKISESWKDGLSFDEEKTEDGKVTQSGFRPPQIGALHALKAHWTVSGKVATVVMPTGTGKTETMIAAACMEQAKCVLIVVPSDALRTQIGRAFSNLGMLPPANLISETAQKPIVTLLRKRPKTVDEAAAIFGVSNVVVTTMSIAAGVSSEIQKTIASFTSHLFIDEAHHVAAKTWREFRQSFDEVKIVQFTATPFRNDGMRVDGKFVFVYPLSLAQNQGYFRKINFEPIEGLDRTEIDGRIIDKVGECLKRDEVHGFKHLAMARGGKRARAEELYQRYRQKLPQYSPVLLHSGLSDGEQAEALKGLRQGRHRIVVCVDMLGEGFDLPELKIAGLHDPKKSEAVTLQFVGRFIRSRDDLGQATVVAAVTKNDATPLASLFAEDADWNKLINLIGTRATERAVRREEVFQGFEGIDADVPLETLRPTLGTVVYKTSDTPWNPVAGVEDFDHRHNIVDGPHINHHDALAIFITARSDQPKWSRFKGISDTVYDLYLVHWDQDAQLLYISATSDDRLDDLAKHLCGDDAERIRGETVFRALNPLRRPVLNTLGLSETRRRKIRYSQYQGSDIADELRSQSGNRTRSKTNLMVVGFSDDGKVSLGCSRKGKIWAQERTNDFGRWMDWCHGLGASLTDETISTSGIIERLIQPVLVTEIPDKPVVGIDWYESMSFIDEDSWTFTINGQQTSIYNCELELTTHKTNDGVFFALKAGEEIAKFKMTINESGVAYESLDPQSPLAEKNTAPVVVERWFHEYPPTLFFADGDTLVADEFFALPDAEVPYFPEDHFEVWDWGQTNIRVESLGLDQRQDSVQAQVVREIRSSTGCHIIFDDDGAGEIADVVAFEVDGNHVTVRFYHCKFSSSSSPGARVADLYEVCGQAQRSVRRCERPQRILDRLLKREAGRIRNGGPSRFVEGSVEDLRMLISRRNQLDYQFEIYVVQPGYSFAEKNSAHSQVLASTEAFVIDTYARKFRIICNA